MTVSIEINVSEPYWPPPSLPGGLVLHWSDPWGNGDLYQTPAGDWFLWKGSLGDIAPGKPWATAISATEARIWLRRAKQRQRERAWRANQRAIEEERAAEAEARRAKERREQLDKL